MLAGYSSRGVRYDLRPEFMKFLPPVRKKTVDGLIKDQLYPYPPFIPKEIDKPEFVTAFKSGMKDAYLHKRSEARKALNGLNLAANAYAGNMLSIASEGARDEKVEDELVDLANKYGQVTEDLDNDDFLKNQGRYGSGMYKARGNDRGIKGSYDYQKQLRETRPQRRGAGFGRGARGQFVKAVRAPPPPQRRRQARQQVAQVVEAAAAAMGVPAGRVSRPKAPPAPAPRRSTRLNAR